MSRWRSLPLLLVLMTWALLAQAQVAFPALTGRVVDQAQLLDTATEQELAQRLDAHEKASGQQLVVVTLENLQGLGIEEFGYQLGRHWGIGQKGKNNGALLLVARDERKVRIEVGYGLEGQLTDAQSWAIIQQAILPSFKAGDFPAGIRAGVAAMLQVLGGEPLPVAQEQPGEAGDSPWLILLVVLFFILISLVGNGRRGSLAGGLLGAVLSGGSGRSSGGGFSGGGGSFGGGGASGGW
ncbi:MAG: TPM domain-containing protein [Pseudomonas sp.]|uniref:TPM domain-containing protein n=1 Tax=Pseudomonas sp. TaxID=306 RepID=UPI0033998F53